MSRSPLAPDRFPSLPRVDGVQLATLAAGLRYEKRTDLMLALVPEGSTVAGVFTKSLCPSAPVEWSRHALTAGAPRALVCNAGNANAFTGAAGDTAAEATADAIADALGLRPSEILLASTGVIGETLPTVALTQAMPDLAAGLAQAGRAEWEAAADAIRTTDTFPKGSFADVEGGGVVAGFAKGSGMIAPDMATMLGFIFTDVKVEQSLLQDMLRSAVQASFNRITVDSDTSTSDTVILFATGQADRNAFLHAPDAEPLQAAIDQVARDLAHQIVRDGEGATKFVEICVTGAVDDDSATAVAFAVGNSPLVKTALAASDANWGRIVMAVGKAGEPADRDRLAIWIGDEQCASNGVMRPGYDEERATRHLQGDEVYIAIDVGVGVGSSTIWTCDLTHGYIEINAGYRS